MSRNITPRPIKASGARDAHGRILDSSAGALYVHMHRESGLAHRHYVLKSWQVRVAAFLLSRGMLLVYFVALVTWGWMASQAARVPLLKQRISNLTRDAERLDTLTATLAQLQARYDQVQKMLSAANAGKTTTDTTRERRVAPADGVRAPRTTPADSARAAPTIPPDTARPARDTSGRGGVPSGR